MSRFSRFSRISRPSALLAAALAGACSTYATVPSPPMPQEKQLLASGAALERAGDRDGALVAYVNVLAAYPMSAEAHYRAATIHAELGNDPTAEQGFQRALRLRPGYLEAMEGMGLLMLRGGQLDAARAMLSAALAQDPSRAAVLNGLGVIEDLGGKRQEAAGLFQRALQAQPGNAEVLNNYGYSLYMAGDLKGAQRLYQQALVAEPGNKKAWSNLGLLRVRERRNMEGVEAFQRVMDRPAAHYTAAYLCMLDGRLAEAETLLKAAIELSPSYFVAAHEALDQVRERRRRVTR